MFKKKQSVIDSSWWAFGENESTGPGGLECPCCGSLYVDGANRIVAKLIPIGNETRKLTDDDDPTILNMTEMDKTPTEIGGVLGVSRQAVTARLRKLKAEDKL